LPKFLPHEKAAYGGHKTGLKNVDFKTNTLENSPGAEAGTLLEIIPVHVKNPPVIQFMAYLDNIRDSFNNQFTEEQPFGRLDPYYIWRSSRRNIQLSLSLPATSQSKALDNLNNLSWLLASLYPTYKDSDSATSIAASPLFRVRYSNLIASRTQAGQGLLCVIKNANVTHSTKEGFMFISPVGMDSSNANVSGQVLKAAGFHTSVSEGETIQIPKLMKLSLALDVVHDHMMGWDDQGNWRGDKSAPKFPYGFGLTRETEPVPGALADESVNGSPDSRNSEAAGLSMFDS